MFSRNKTYKLIILSAPDRSIASEAIKINALFQEGMDIFHLRKKTWFKKEVSELIDVIDEKYHGRIMLHSHPELIEAYDLKGFHFNKDYPVQEKWIKLLRTQDKTISVASHSICDMGEYELEVDYQLVSPVFPSISKSDIIETIDYKKVSDYLLLKPKSEFIALGGIRPDNLEKAFSLGFDGVAALGWIWVSDGEPVKRYNELKDQLDLIKSKQSEHSHG